MGIRAEVKGIVLGITESEFVRNEGEKDEEILKSIKLKIHDKISKTDLNIKFAGTVEEFQSLDIQEYETYDIALEFNPYSMNGRNAISCKVIDIKI